MCLRMSSKSEDSTYAWGRAQRRPEIMAPSSVSVSLTRLCHFSSSRAWRFSIFIIPLSRMLWVLVYSSQNRDAFHSFQALGPRSPSCRPG